MVSGDGRLGWGQTCDVKINLLGRDLGEGPSHPPSIIYGAKGMMGEIERWGPLREFASV